MGTEAKAPPRRLVSHRTCAAWFDMTPRTWRRRYEMGKVPAPHQVIGTDLLYDREVIDHRLKTGLWPEGQDFVLRRTPKKPREKPAESQS